MGNIVATACEQSGQDSCDLDVPLGGPLWFPCKPTEFSFELQHCLQKALLKDANDTYAPKRVICQCSRHVEHDQQIRFTEDEGPRRKVRGTRTALGHHCRQFYEAKGHSGGIWPLSTRWGGARRRGKGVSFLLTNLAFSDWPGWPKSLKFVDFDF